jgi:hypothetical protein
MNLCATEPTGKHRGRLYQAFVLLCALVFTWQVLAATSHHHDLAERVHDCVSCHIAGSLHGGVPPAPAVAAAAAPAVLYVLPQAAAPHYFAAPSYLIPPRQAPPARIPRSRVLP